MNKLCHCYTMVIQWLYYCHSMRYTSDSFWMIPLLHHASNARSKASVASRVGRSSTSSGENEASHQQHIVWVAQEGALQDCQWLGRVTLFHRVTSTNYRIIGPPRLRFGHFNIRPHIQPHRTISKVLLHQNRVGSTLRRKRKGYPPPETQKIL